MKMRGIWQRLTSWALGTQDNMNGTAYQSAGAAFFVFWPTPPTTHAPHQPERQNFYLLYLLFQNGYINDSFLK
jgi:hypothetical protein